MGHEWKIGDWAEANGNRYFVYRVVGSSVFGVMESGTPSWDIACKAKHLPDCTGWDWEPSKPVEPDELPAHDWKFGDWAKTRQRNIVRFVSVDSDGDFMFVEKSGDISAFNAEFLVYLPDCTGFDWTPPSPVKSIEPPPGYRILGREEILQSGDICVEVGLSGRNTDWRDCGTLCVGHKAGFRIDKYGAVCFARKAEIVNPIEPPPGYRIITDGVVSDGDMSLQDCGWYYSTAKGKDIAELLDLGAAKAYARKIEQPKSNEPPAGYRLVASGEVVVAGDMYFDGCWQDVPKYASAMGRPWDAETQYPICRKIEPRYRPFANAAEFAPHRDRWVRLKSDTSMQMRVVCYNDRVVWIESDRVTGNRYGYVFDRFVFEDGTPFGVLEDSQ